MSAKIKVQLNPVYKVNGNSRALEILPWLEQVNEIAVVADNALPPLSIAVNDRIVAVVDPFDEPQLTSACDEGSTIQRVKDLQPLLIFKYQWQRGMDYPPGTINAGYPCVKNVTGPPDLLTRKRTITVTARMRVNGDYQRNTEWMMDRSRIVAQARLLERLGQTTRYGMTGANEYISELWDSQIGFDWRGYGYLTHRLIEYIRAGVIPITRPLGDHWPIREDVILEDGVHCIFCPDPFNFAREASRLLLEPQKIACIRRNLLQVWEERLCPKAQGYWLWSKLRAAIPGLIQS